MRLYLSCRKISPYTSSPATPISTCKEFSTISRLNAAFPAGLSVRPVPCGTHCRPKLHPVREQMFMDISWPPLTTGQLTFNLSNWGPQTCLSMFGNAMRRRWSIGASRTTLRISIPMRKRRPTAALLLLVPVESYWVTGIRVVKVPLTESASSASTVTSPKLAPLGIVTRSTPVFPAVAG